jgi:hypothetical protein
VLVAGEEAASADVERDVRADPRPVPLLAAHGGLRLVDRLGCRLDVDPDAGRQA